VTLALVAVVLFGIVAALLARSADRPHHSLTLPQTAGDYTRLSTLSTTQLRSIFAGGGFGSLSWQDLTKAKVGIYTRSAQTVPTMLFMGFSAADSPTIGRQLRSQNSREVADEVLAGAGASTASLEVAAGPFGGTLKCSHLVVGGTPAEVGVWVDSDTLGIVLLFDPSFAPSREQTGQVTRAVRAKAEH
jgi:hypothetical protein